MKKIFIANWKMQLTPEEAVSRLRSFAKVFRAYKGKAFLCPDFLSLGVAAKLLAKSPLSFGAQDAAAFVRGAYTGEISPVDIAAMGADIVILGHSERRTYLGESDKIIAAKIKAAIDSGLVPVLCVGENASERKRGQALSVIRSQLKGALQSLPLSSLRRLIIAYEPVWAIGTGLSCGVEQALAVKSGILEWCRRFGLKSPAVLYGGSVNSDNAKPFLISGGFDGFLVGGAGLNPQEFLAIASL